MWEQRCVLNDSGAGGGGGVMVPRERESSQRSKKRSKEGNGRKGVRNGHEMTLDGMICALVKSKMPSEMTNERIELT